MKKVEILLSTYNGEKYLSEQLDSLLKQTFKNFRIIIRDDRSNDKTLNILNAYARKHPEKIIIIESEENLGPAGSFSELLNHAEAEYVFFCDQDDIWLENKLETYLLFVSEIEITYGKDIPFLIHSDCYITDNQMNIISNSYYKYMNSNPKRNKLNNLLVKNTVVGCTCMINRNLIKKSMPIPNNIYMHDWWLALCASITGKIFYIEKPLIKYRQHSFNVVGAKKTKNYFRRLRKLLPWEDNSNYTELIDKLIDQAESLKNLHKDNISFKDRKLIETFISTREFSFYKRVTTLISSNILKSNLIENLELLLRYRPEYNNPQISIIMPVYNREKYLQRAIESVLNQTYKNFEFIIINDGSSDKSEEIILSYKDPRIKYIYYTPNKGANHARNIGLRKSKGKYITFQDSDIFIKPDKISQQYSYIEKNKKNYDIIYCLYEYNKDNKVTILPGKKSRFTGNIYDKLITGNFIDLTSVMVKKECFIDNLFEESLPRLQDYELFLRLSRKYRFGLLEKVLYISYYTEGSISSNHHNLIIASDFIQKKHRNIYIEERIEFLIKKHNLKEIIIYGYSTSGQYVKKILEKKSINIVGIYDQNKYIIPENVYLDIFSSRQYENTYIIITSSGHTDKIENILAEYGYIKRLTIF
ncbi:MAG: glycosyltransferase [Candidatus Muirbacterium halophilum]|nr:glycosyltransferase [Candidatus Muirbacterium halophilum]MCK9474598.1 glycosyltransferase [Candidatus Muirbacterium halophilum]